MTTTKQITATMIEHFAERVAFWNAIGTEYALEQAEFYQSLLDHVTKQEQGA